jgi:hypothetical protein
MCCIIMQMSQLVWRLHGCQLPLTVLNKHVHNTPTDNNRLCISEVVIQFACISLIRFILEFLPGVDKSQTFDGKC